MLPFLAAFLLGQGMPESEPNPSATLSTPIALGSQGAGAIDVAGDFDYWRITLANRSDLRCWTNPGIGAALGDSDLTLIATDGLTEVLFNDDTPQSPLSQIVAGNLAAGDYYVRVRSSQSQAPNGIGTYTIDVVAAPPGTYVVVPTNNGPGLGAPVTEAAEPNDPRQASGSATPSLENSVNSGVIATGTAGVGFADPTADYDFYELQITRPGQLEIETLPTVPFPAMRDTVLFLTRANLEILRADDDGGFGRFSRLSHWVYPATYYVAVKGQDAGNYVLDIRFAPMTPPGAASVSMRGGGCGPTLGVRSTTISPNIITEVPVLGSTFFLCGANLPANAIIIKVIGTDPLTPALDLLALGAPGCIVEVDPIDQSFDMANAAGDYHWGLSSPLDPAYIGLTIEQQLAVFDTAANALGLTLSNRVSSICGIHN